MARTDTLGHFLTDIANKIRSKTGSQSNITPANYDTEIDNIKFGDGKEIYVSFNPPYNMSASSFSQTVPTITSINLKNLDTSNMPVMIGMFYKCSSLTSLDLSSFDTSNTVLMTNMFNGCSSLTSLDLSSFDTSKVTNMTNMFNNCTNLESIIFGENFTFEKISGGVLGTPFKNCTKLDNNTLNAILHLCTTTTSAYTGNKKLTVLGISDSFDNYANIPNLSNYQAFLDAGWTIS